MAKISYLSVCFCAILTAAVCLSASASVATTETKPDQRVGAVITEWYLAHCGTEGVPDVMINASSMVINGSEDEEIDRLREDTRKQVKARFASDEAACEGLLSVLKRTFSP